MGGALSPYRVLDLTTGRAAIGPLILADLGADVIKIEPPGGCPDRGHPSCFAALNRNKQGVEIDFASEAGRERFQRMVVGADFLFENRPPGGMEKIGLGFDRLRVHNPRLVHIAVTPFGQDGPYAQHQATDLTLAAMGGMMAVNGDPDRPPVRVSVPQSWLHAGAESAIGALVAHRRMLQTGEAQYVDVSAQTAVFWTLMNAMLAHPIQGSDLERNGGRTRVGSESMPLFWSSVDGYTVFSLSMLNALPRLIPLLLEAGLLEEKWRAGEDWSTYFDRVRGGRPVELPLAALVERVQSYIGSRSRNELLADGLARGISFAPVNNIGEVLDLEHLEQRGYWSMLPDARARGGEVRIPGPFARLSRTPIEYRRAAPERDGRSHVAEMRSARADVPARHGNAKGELPFSGLNIADFSWVGVGPSTAKYLADHGALTVRVESEAHADVLRRGVPFKDGVAGINRSQYFGSFNTSKFSLALDLKSEAGRSVAQRLLAWADVCLESFTPGTMTALGLGYETASKLNPSIIYVSTCLMGQSGPLAPFAGFGYHAAAMAGFADLTGWPDRAPVGPSPPYTDTMANRFLAASIMAALDHRRRSGEGQYIEQSQLEAALHFLAPEIVEYQVDGALPRRCGNESPFAAPHGAYPCKGEDRWCAIAVETDEQWRALCGLAGDYEWARDESLAAASCRLARRKELDQRLAEWTITCQASELMSELQAAGIPAGVVQRSSDLIRDPQLQHRHFFRRLLHAEMGEVPYEGHQFRIRGYDSGPRWAAPVLGEHSAYVLREILGMPDDEIAELAVSGALA